MRIATVCVRTFIAVACGAGLSACVDGDDIHGPGDNETVPTHLRSFELIYDGQKLSWTPTQGEAYQGLLGAMHGDVFDISADLLSLEDHPGILKDDGFAGVVWRAPGGQLAKGQSRCDHGEVVMSIRFPHVGHLVTHADAVDGGAPVIATPVTDGVGCVIDVTRADKVGGFVEGTITATLAYVPFEAAAPSVVDLRQISGRFKLSRSADVVE